MTDRALHIVLLVGVAVLVLAIAGVLAVGCARLREYGKAALAADPHAITL